LEMKKQTTVVITGFGPFGGVKENPSMLLVAELIAQYEKNGFNMFLPQENKDAKYDCKLVFKFQVLEVSVQDCNDMYKKYPVREDEEFIFVHIGVDAGGVKIKLEEMAYNNMSFRIPDERGYQPTESPIISNESMPLDFSLQTAVPLNEVINQVNYNLQEKFSNMLPLLVLSSDPGRFLCNYVYFCSMCHGLDIYQCNEVKPKKAVFIHVPPFSMMAMPTQLSVVLEAIRWIVFYATN